MCTVVHVAFVHHFRLRLFVIHSQLHDVCVHTCGWNGGGQLTEHTLHEHVVVTPRGMWAKTSGDFPRESLPFLFTSFRPAGKPFWFYLRLFFAATQLTVYLYHLAPTQKAFSCVGIFQLFFFLSNIFWSNSNKMQKRRTWVSMESKDFYPYRICAQTITFGTTGFLLNL
jgi:hypothetical protein